MTGEGAAIAPGRGCEDRTKLPRIAPALMLAAFLVVALALKATTFGDPNRHTDETFYFLVGQRMHDGLLPYVDVWDRKPLGLFLIYYLIAGISTSVWAYQIAACLFGAATALVIGLTVVRWAGYGGGLAAGLAYLFTLCVYDGLAGQAPDFYNLLIAGAALLIVREDAALRNGSAPWSVAAAMALCGVAITVKQTAVFESMFLGLWATVALARSEMPRRRLLAVAAGWALVGALPMLLIAAYYWQVGHWAEFWHAMVTSNVAKTSEGGEARRGLALFVRGLVPMGFAVWGLLRSEAPAWMRCFLALWIAVAVVGFFSVPNVYSHYALPLAVPLSVAAGLLFGTHPQRLLLFAAFAAFSSLWYTLDQREWTRTSVRSMTVLTGLIRQHDPGGGLLVFDAPPYLYATSGKRLLSPLTFPQHLNHQIENDVSHLNTHAELDRILAGKPGVVVMKRFPGNNPVNAGSRLRVLDYVRHHCRLVGIVPLQEGPYIASPAVVFGDCGARKEG